MGDRRSTVATVQDMGIRERGCVNAYIEQPTRELCLPSCDKAGLSRQTQDGHLVHILQQSDASCTHESFSPRTNLHSNVKMQTAASRTIIAHVLALQRRSLFRSEDNLRGNGSATFEAPP